MTDIMLTMGGGRARGRSPEYRTMRSNQQASQPRSRRIEFVFLPGLGFVVEAELRERLSGIRGVRMVTGRSDAI
ncbi:hypothetical protein, partial [Trebonia sp.]|uniref:hypothetical protein n=1 Tax=Trebonia sp. TaxID=2767075 RepID=UPI002623CBEC